MNTVKKKRKSPPIYVEPEEKTKMLTEHFDKFNCEYLGRPRFEHKDNMAYRAVRFQDCGHEQDVCYTNSLSPDTKSGPVCQQCQKAIKSSFFKKHNYEVLEQLTKDKFLVRKPCGHVNYAYITRMKKLDKIACRDCIHEKHLAKCEKTGVEFLESVTYTEANYKFKCCGVIKRAYKSAVDRGNCVCPSCGNGWMTKPSKLYLFEMEKDNGDVFLKFGYGKDLENRIKEYRLKNCKVKSKLLAIEAVSGLVAMREELRIHSELGETLDPMEMRKYLTRGGYTECYDYSKLETILIKMKEAMLTL